MYVWVLKDFTEHAKSFKLKNERWKTPQRTYK